MAEIKIKRSSVTGRVPTTSDLALGELAINTFDGKLFLKRNNGSDSIVEVGAAAVASFNTRTGAVTLSSDDVTGALGFTPYNATNPSGYITSSALSSYLPLSGGTLTGALNWAASAGLGNGNARSLVTGYSGGNYGQTGYGISFTGTSGLHNYAINDIVSLWEAYDGLMVYAAAGGAVGSAITWTTVLDARRSNSALVFKGQTVLDAGNYNSYSPTLTGGGASGSWGISVTGSSAGLTDNSAWMLSRGSVAEASIDSATSNGFYVINRTGHSTSVLTWNAGGSTGPVQLDFYYSGTMQFRNKTDSTTWTAWKTVLTSSNYTSYSPSLTGSGASGTWGISVSGSAASATDALRLVFNDGPRDLSDRLPNSFTRTVNFDFVNAGVGNGSGNYAGVMTFAPWTGTTAGTGDSSYQLAFANTSGVNASGQPKLSIRNGIDSTWNAWYTLLHSGNSTSYPSAYAPLLSAVGSYSFSASTNGRDFGTGVQAGFVSDGQGYPSYGSVVRVKTYSNDGGTAELYFPYSATYGGSAMRYRLGQYDNAGWTDWKTVLDSSNYSSYALPLSGGTLSGNLSISSGVVINFAGQSDTVGYNVTAGFGTYIKGTGNTYVYGGGSFYDGSSHRALLHAGNYSSYSSFSGAVTSAGNNGFYNDVYYGGVRNPIWSFGNATSYGISYYQGSAGIGGVDAIGFSVNGTTSVTSNNFAISSSASYVNNNIVLHAGNYNSYALPLSGGTTSGYIRVAADWASGVHNEQLTVKGTYASIALRNTTNNGQVWLVHNDGNFNLYGANDGNPDSNSWTNRFRLTNAGQLDLSGNIVLHAGNYTSYALPLSGGTLSGNLTINGTLSATSKSFLIAHPTKPNMKLRYGSLEGPENGVYVRGKLKGDNKIELPEYWTKLVDVDTITVSLTAIGKSQDLYVEDIVDNVVYVAGQNINCFYVVYAERIDIGKLQVEISQ